MGTFGNWMTASDKLTSPKLEKPVTLCDFKLQTSDPQIAALVGTAETPAQLEVNVVWLLLGLVLLFTILSGLTVDYDQESVFFPAHVGFRFTRYEPESWDWLC